MAEVSCIPLSQLESGDDLSYEETLSLWRALETIAQDPVVGLHAGARFTLDQMGVVGPMLAHCTHVDAALDALVRIMNIFVSNAGIRRVDTKEASGLEYRMPTLRSRHGLDTIFAATLALKRHCTGMQVRPYAVEHQMPACAEMEYAKFFGVTPLWNSATSRLWFARADLLLPFRGASPALAELLAEHAPRLMSGMKSPSFERQIEQAFWTSDPNGGASIEGTAASLGISTRTLQRRLTTMGSTFAEQRSNILHRRAVELLRNDDLTIDTIAERLGYGSRPAFERAFLRWTGKTPHAVRRETGRSGAPF